VNRARWILTRSREADIQWLAYHGCPPRLLKGLAAPARVHQDADPTSREPRINRRGPLMWGGGNRRTPQAPVSLDTGGRFVEGDIEPLLGPG
jgi:hypothetical protein